MQIARYIANFLCTVAFLIVGSYTGIAVLTGIFIVLGTLTPGDLMFYDLRTPTLSYTLAFACAGSVITATLAYARQKLSPKAPA